MWKHSSVNTFNILKVVQRPILGNYFLTVGLETVFSLHTQTVEWSDFDVPKVRKDPMWSNSYNTICEAFIKENFECGLCSQGNVNDVDCMNAPSVLGHALNSKCCGLRFSQNLFENSADFSDYHCKKKS